MDFRQFVGFDWDAGNEIKNWLKHTVTKIEIEQVFFNHPILLFHDAKHSGSEGRNYVLGKTDAERKLMIVFTVRGDRIRVISARSMSKNEKDIYEKTT